VGHEKIGCVIGKSLFHSSFLVLRLFY